MSFLGGGGAFAAHGNADVDPFERRHIVHTVACHGYDGIFNWQDLYRA